MTLSTTRGYCRRIGTTVTEGQCHICFSAATYAGAQRRQDSSKLRMRCVEASIKAEPLPPITADDLNGLSEVRIRHILGNVTMIAQVHPHEATAQTVVREVRLHLAGVELPTVLDPGKEGG